ncbi:GlsB/YeaQ/YmgE family stress response membrane protein, partial [Alcanivorax sp. HI0044]
VVGGWLGSLTGLGGSVSGFSLGSFITAIVGALVLLALYRMVKKN